MEKFFEQLRFYLAENPPSFGDAESALGLLYEIYSESNKLDDRKIRARSDGAVLWRNYRRISDLAP